MRRTALLIVSLVSTAANPAAAESAYLDLSQPMTGVSRFVFDADGTPVQLGRQAPVETTPKVEVSRAAQPVTGACSGDKESCPTEPAMATRAGGDTRRAGPVIVPMRVNLPGGQAAGSSDHPRAGVSGDGARTTTRARSGFRLRRR